MRVVPRINLRHRLLALFVATSVIPSAALAWLGWQLVEQDRQLERQRVRDALESASSATAAGIERELNALDRSLPTLLTSGFRTGEAIVARITRTGVAASAGAPLLYRPAVPVAFNPDRTEPWGRGEGLEFAQNDFAGAIREYHRLAQHSSGPVRAGALVRLARVLKKADRHEEALAVYSTLAELPDIVAGGEPAGLLARRARLDLLERLGRSDDIRIEATSLSRDIVTGRWPVDRATYLTYARNLERWTGRAPLASPATLALSEAVSLTAAAWRTQDVAIAVNARRRAIRVNSVPLLEMTRAEGDTLLFFAATPGHLASAWHSIRPAEGVAMSLTDDTGNLVLGKPADASEFMTIRAASDTGLPWTLRMSTASAPPTIAASGSTRRKLLLIGLALLTVLLTTTGYLANRAVRRELAVAKQQSDFVAAVSHEFRSPLTALTHLTSLLRGEFEPSGARRRQYYDALARETDRLRRFIETLLDFGRMQAGAARFRLQPIAAVPLVHALVEEFKSDPAVGSHPVAFDGANTPCLVSADRAALERAIWNLLENAAKYSDGHSAIVVSVERENEMIAIRVSDRGVGIPLHEQPHVFTQFFRGEAAAASAVKGTGVGLAVAHHIVRAHDGEIHLKSHPGVGSTFTILLPICDATSQASSRRAS